MIQTVNYKGNVYPLFQTEGNSAQFILPFAQKVCRNLGYDIGCNRKEWSLPGSIPIDISLNNGYDAFTLPYSNVDYIFSSHCLEHIFTWTTAMDYWHSVLKPGGVLFLYLPDYSQVYWRPWNNKKHIHSFTPRIIHDYMTDKGYRNIFCSGVDLNNSFSIMGER